MTQDDTKMQRANTIKMLVPQLVHDDSAQESKLVEQFTFVTQIQVMPHRSRRVRCQPNRYMFLGETYDMIPNELNAKPVNYN